MVGDAVVAFVGALLMAQAWEPSDVKSVIPIINVTVPTFPQVVILGIVALLAVMSFVPALASAVRPLRSWAIHRVSPYSQLLARSCNCSDSEGRKVTLTSILSRQGRGGGEAPSRLNSCPLISRPSPSGSRRAVRRRSKWGCCRPRPACGGAASGARAAPAGRRAWWGPRRVATVGRGSTHARR